MSSSEYDVVFNNALKPYKKKTGNDLASDPLLHRLETCNSPGSLLALLKDQIPGFDQSGNSDERLTKWVNQVVNVLYNFAATIGGAVSFAYPPAGVIFTGIASLLSAVLAVSSSQGALVDLFERIENFFIRLGTYIELPPTAEMTDIIVKVMVDVLLILALVTKEMKQGKMKRFLKRMAAAQGLRATHGMSERVTSLGDGMNVAINAVIDGGENMREELQKVARLQGTLVVALSLAVQAQMLIGNQLRKDLTDWLSPPDPFIDFNTADHARHEGTAEWFTQSSVFRNWKESSSFLWIHGKHLYIHSGLWEICSHLCDHPGYQERDARALLSSLIVQLSNQSDDFYDVLLRFYSDHHRGTQQPSIGALTQCLEDMLRVPEELPIYLIIDALDECPNTTGILSPRDEVLTLVEGLVNLNLRNLRLCVTSRPETDIRTSLEPLTSPSNSISLHDESGQNKDIVDFTLDETYERILREIPKTNRVHAHRLLQCLTVAVRLLKVEELAEVLAINFDAEGGIPKLNEGFRWADQEHAVLSACSSLVAIVEDRNSRRVQSSHFSVKEFLTSDRLAASAVDVLRGHHIRLEAAHTIMAQACLGVLLRLDHYMDKETIELSFGQICW
ncbi:hypothetical protein DFH94DRAFT_699530 [Russula ochroleuca]|uniref:Fungal STAND N-terminal Goodbye domain-containing protein n=1 Tax=Russula ochroleuca TaxID=152965 RepID=A0A9P5JTY0_9AGAM|nr:hypothetical protein DFH94DRAFT_699530 [Russula ochroleuca]